uniref:DNA-directed RNA polymerase subunit beta' n=1 Tax=Prasiolopsis wulf-kochii TaxID=3239232 RepID=A0A097KK26_9CHLO|nr:beta' subunit of RNA polymerase [Prasiolopsis sp. SAG 84.81]
MSKSLIGHTSTQKFSNNRHLFKPLKKSSEAQIDSINIGLASPIRILKWSERILPNGKKVGEVVNAKTVNYKTLKPETGGLFCEKIFGPIEDFECLCNPAKRKPKTQNKFCPDCDVEFTVARVRRYRLGHIKLASPVSHIWYLRGRPRFLNILFDRAISLKTKKKKGKIKDLKPIIYGMDGIYVPIFRLLKTNREISSEATLRKKRNFFLTQKKPSSFSEENLAKTPPFVGKTRKTAKTKPSFCNEVTRVKKKTMFFFKPFSSFRRPCFARAMPFGHRKQVRKTCFAGPRVFLPKVRGGFGLRPAGKPNGPKTGLFARPEKGPKGVFLTFVGLAKQKLRKKHNFFLTPKSLFGFLRKKRSFCFAALAKQGPVGPKVFAGPFGLLRYREKPFSKPFGFFEGLAKLPFSEPFWPSPVKKKTMFFFNLEKHNFSGSLGPDQKKPRPEKARPSLFGPRFYNSTWNDAQATLTTKINFVPLRSPGSHKQPIKLSASIFTYNFLHESGLLWYDLVNHNVNPNISLSSVYWKNKNNFSSFCGSLFARNKSCFARPFGLSRANTFHFFFKTRYFTRASKNTCSAAPTKENILFKKNFNKIVCNSRVRRTQVVRTCHCQYNPQSLPTTAKTKANLNGLKFNLCADPKTIYPYQKNKNLVFNRNKQKKMTGFLREEKLFLNIEVLKTENLIFFTEKKSANLPVGQQKNQLLLSFPLIKSKFYYTRKNLLIEAPFVLETSPEDTSTKNPFRFSNPEAAFLTVQSVGSQKLRWFAEASNLPDSKNLSEATLGPNKLAFYGLGRSLRPFGPFVVLRKKHSFCFAAHKRPLGFFGSLVSSEHRNKPSEKSLAKQPPSRPFGPNEVSLAKQAIAKQSNAGRLGSVGPLRSGFAASANKFFGPFWAPKGPSKTLGPTGKPNGPEAGVFARPVWGPKGPAKKPKVRRSCSPASQGNLLSQIDSYYPISSRCVFKFIKGEENKTLEFKDLWSSFTKYMTSNFVKQDMIIQRYSNRLGNRYTLQNGLEYKSIKAVLTGSEAICYWLKNLNLHVLESILKKKIKNLDDKINRHRSRAGLYKFQKKTLKNIIKYRRKVYRIIKLVHYLKRNRLRPDWLMISILPVLPPNLRPIIQLQSNQMAVSDLNQLYKRVLYRNTRIEKYFNRSRETDSHERRFHQRLLQEAVDSLLDNGKGGSPLACSPNGRPFKSLAEILKGKKGRFRQNLLGKRVDYSGRSVIVVGPELKLHECGLPKEMALELFQPFIIRDLINLSHQDTDEKITIVLAKYLIKTEHSIVWKILQKILKNHPILLNRAPTLHRLGIQAFQPKLVDGRAILLHPLVCPAFNADFDGDQMAVHVPLCFQSRAEAWKLMWSRNNLLSPATGEPIIVPSQDMVLGCYYLTTINSNSVRRAFNYPQSSFSVGGKSTFTIREAREVPRIYTSKAKPKTVFPTTLKFSALGSFYPKVGGPKVFQTWPFRGLDLVLAKQGLAKQAKQSSLGSRVLRTQVRRTFYPKSGGPRPQKTIQTIRKKHSFCFAAHKRPLGFFGSLVSSEHRNKPSEKSLAKQPPSRPFGPNEVSLAKQAIAKQSNADRLGSVGPLRSGFAASANKFFGPFWASKGPSKTLGPTGKPKVAQFVGLAKQGPFNFLRKKRRFCFSTPKRPVGFGESLGLAKQGIKSTSITIISKISENLACSDILTVQNNNYSKNQFKQSIVQDGDVNVVMLGKYFSSLEDVLVAFSQNQLFLHSLIWVKWADTVEIENFNEKPIEIRIDRYGNVQKIYSKYFKHVDNQNRQISQFILTTVGRIILNKTITKNSSF